MCVLVSVFTSESVRDQMIPAICMGAIRMAGVRTFYFASRDPWAGCSAMTEQVPYLKRKDIRGIPPQLKEFEDVLTALQVEMHLRRGTLHANPDFFAVYHLDFPTGAAVGEELYATERLQVLAEKRAGVEEVFGVLHDLVR